MLIAMADMIPGKPLARAMPACARTWIEFALATPVVLWAGWPFFVRGWASIVNRSLNMFTLIGLGAGAAYLFSVVAALAPGSVSRIVSRRRRRGAGLLRGRRRHHRAGAARPGAGAARAQPDRRAIRRCWASRRRPRASQRRRPRRRRPARSRRHPAIACACGPARKSRSTASCRRRERGRRVDGHRRADPGREERRAPRDRRRRSTAPAAS